jgi:hypothetical protein
VLSTVINVYTARDGGWSPTALITLAVEGGCAIVCGILYLIYRHLLRRTKRDHKRQMEGNAGRGNTDEEMGVESSGSEAKAEGQSPTTPKGPSRQGTTRSKGPSRQGTARSNSTTKGDSPVASKRLSEFQATHSPTEEEVGNEDQPDISLTPKKPPLGHHLSEITQVDDLPGEQSEGPEGHPDVEKKVTGITQVNNLPGEQSEGPEAE